VKITRGPSKEHASQLCKNIYKVHHGQNPNMQAWIGHGPQDETKIEWEFAFKPEYI
jgi:hypothetical protein